MVARVFISHASEDLVLASEVHQWLVEAGYKVFLDQDLRNGLKVGDDWQQRLHEWLRRSDAVVCVVTSAYRASTWCSAEVGIAQSRGSLLLPVQAEPGVTHPLLTPTQYTDYTRDPAAARAALVEALRQVDAAGGLGWPDNRSPFPGLEPFDVDQHRAFFGRIAEIRQLADLLRSPAERAEGAVLLVVGPSGCGKSSLVRAGLVPKMAQESGWWTLDPIVPGADPVAALVQELAAAARQIGLDWTGDYVRDRLDTIGLTGLVGELLLAAPGGPQRHLLIVVDQFEELLIHASPTDRSRFATLLRPALTGPVQVVGTLRPEFLDQTLANSELDVLPTRTFALRPLGREALRDVIEEPAELVGIEVEDGLVARLVDDTVSGEALPLLAFTLAQLADGVGRGEQLSSTRYEQLGGVQGALTRQADAALADAVAASGRSREEVIAGLLRLVTVDKDGRPSRRRVLRAELPDPVVIELDTFIKCRLLTTASENEEGSVFVGVAHETFLSAWRPLARAIAAVASALRVRDEVEQAAAEWIKNSRPSLRLWEGGRLAAAVADVSARIRITSRSDVATRTDTQPHPLHKRGLSRLLPGQRRVLISDRVALNEEARDFLHKSIRRDRYRRRRATTVLSVLLTVVLAAAGVAIWQQQSATEQRDRALSRAIAIEADQLRSSDSAVSRQLSIAAYQISPTAEALGGLLSSTSLMPVTRQVNHEGETWATAASQDRGTLATAGSDGTVRLWAVDDPAHPVPLATIPVSKDAVFAVALHPEGKMLANGSYDGTVRLWDLTDPRNPRSLSIPLTGHDDSVASVAFSPDGTTLASGSYDGTVRLWDLTDPRNPRSSSMPLIGHDDRVTSVAFSPDGTTLASGSYDWTVRLWNVTDRQQPFPAGPPLSLHANDVNAVAFSPDGKKLATASADYMVRLWDVTDPRRARPLGEPLAGHENAVYSVAFSSDGTRIASGSNDATVRVWDVATESTLRVLPHPQPVQGVAFLRTANEIVTGGNDGLLRLWHLPGGILVGHKGPVLSTVFSRDGRTLASGSIDNTVILWDVTNPAHPSPVGPPLTGSAAPVQRMAFSPEGRLLAVPRVDGTIELWNVADPTHPILASPPIIAHQDDVLSVAFSPNGSVLASGSADSTVRLWDVTNPARPSPIGTPLSDRSGAVFTVAFSSDDNTLAAGGGDNTTRLYDVSDPAHPRPLGDPLGGHKGYVLWVAFGPNSHTLATAGADGVVWLWNTTNRQHPIARHQLRNAGEAVLAVAFARDGMLAMANADASTWLWDITDPSPTVVAKLTGHQDEVFSVAFSPTARLLATGSADASAVLWKTDPAEVIRGICADVGQPLTQDEWKRFIPERAYERPCP